MILFLLRPNFQIIGPDFVWIWIFLIWTFNWRHWLWTTCYMVGVVGDVVVVKWCIQGVGPPACTTFLNSLKGGVKKTYFMHFVRQDTKKAPIDVNTSLGLSSSNLMKTFNYFIWLWLDCQDTWAQRHLLQIPGDKWALLLLIQVYISCCSTRCINWKSLLMKLYSGRND